VGLGITAGHLRPAVLLFSGACFRPLPRCTRDAGLSHRSGSWNCRWITASSSRILAAVGRRDSSAGFTLRESFTLSSNSPPINAASLPSTPVSRPFHGRFACTMTLYTGVKSSIKETAVVLPGVINQDRTSESALSLLMLRSKVAERNTMGTRNLFDPPQPLIFPLARGNRWEIRCA
jgi:hypothetical protein